MRKPPALNGKIVGLNGWLCDVDETAFRAQNRLPIYPGVTNWWVVTKSPTASGSVESVVEDFLDPIDPGFFTDTLFQAKRLDAPYVGPKTNIKISNNLTPPIRMKVSGEVSGCPGCAWYLIAFNAPATAPTEIEWPYVGCPEAADWAVTQVLNPSDPAETVRAAQESMDQFFAKTQGGPVTGGGGLSSASKALIGIGVLGVAWYVLAKKHARSKKR